MLTHGYIMSSRAWGLEVEQKEPLRKEHKEIKITDTLTHACAHTAKE